MLITMLLLLIVVGGEPAIPPRRVPGEVRSFPPAPPVVVVGTPPRVVKDWLLCVNGPFSILRLGPGPTLGESYLEEGLLGAPNPRPVLATGMAYCIPL